MTAVGTSPVTIEVHLHGATVPIQAAAFATLLDNSVAGTYADYRRALDSASITFEKLQFLARKGDIPVCLFFAPLPVVAAQVSAKTKKLLNGVSKGTFSIGSRAKVELRDVELVVKDLLRKQELLKRCDSTLTRNAIVGLLRKSGRSAEDDAARLKSALGLSHEGLRGYRTKEKALEALIERLEANQVLVSRSVQHYMPQRLTHVTFSGMTVRDAKVPYIFLAGGEHGDYQEPVGRTVFTLALMTVLVARAVFKPVTWDGHSTGTSFGREYDIAGALLMPAARLREIAPHSLDDMKAASEEFKSTASAVTVRAMRLGIISSQTARSYLDELRAEFGKRQRPKGMKPIRPENAVRKYNGRELTSRMINALDAGRITPGEFCRAVCLNRLKPSQIPDLRGVLA